MRSAGRPARTFTGRSLDSDAVWITAVALATLCLYAATVRPDVGGPEDSPKFQFLGFVLGTAHSPGYPLYVLLTHLFGKLPIGTVAFRANLFSGLMGAAACSLVFVIARQLGAARVSALAASAALATGAVFWRYSILAEVYTLAAALGAGVMSALIAWGQRPARWRLFLACGLFALGLGNHLIIIGLLPAALAYGIWRDRSVLRPRTVAAAALIGVLGLTQYAFVLLRTRQAAPYLEARAESVPQLVDLLLARDLEKKRLQFGVGTILTERVPVIARYASRELWPAGLAVVLLGCARAAKRRQVEAALLAGAVAGMLAVVVNIKGDVAGFLVPVLVLAWPLAALGFDVIRSVAAPLGRAAPWLSAALALSLPSARLVAGEPQVAHLRRTDDAASFRALYAALPAHAAVVYEDYWTQTVLLYLHLSDEIVPDPSPAFIPTSARAARAALADGRQLFAFAGSAAWLETIGLGFRPADLARSSLASWLRQLPRGTRVAIAIAGQPLPPEIAPADARGTGLGRPRPFGAMSWTIGDRSFVVRQDDSATSLSVPLPRPWWRPVTGPLPTVELAASAGGARVVIGPERVEVPEGTVVVTVRPDGTIQRRLSYGRDAPLTVSSLVSMMTFDHEVACETLDAQRTVDVSRVLENGGWLTTADHLGRAVIDLRFGIAPAPVVRQRVVQGAGRTATESLADGRTRLVLDRTGWQRPIFRMTVLGTPGPVLASLAPGGVADQLRVCALSAPAVLPPGAASGEIAAGAEADDNYGAGWHVAERSGSTRFRWAERSATLLLPMRDEVGVEIALRLSPASSDGATVHATMNERQTGSCMLPGGAWTTCRFTVPAAVMRAGLNRLTLTSTTSVVPAGTARERRELAFSTRGGTLRILR